ncbi:MAG: diadenylate cyclase [bacterium]|nr:diadenylate cyclase [bacterium]
MGLEAIVPGRLLGSLPWAYIVDIAIMWFVAYQIYIRFRGTQAMRLLLRVFTVWLSYMVAQAAGLTLTAFLLWALWLAGLIFFLITFQRDILRIFMQMNPMRRLPSILRSARRVKFTDENIAAAAQSLFRLAEKRIGALVVLERTDALESLMRSPGEEINAEIQPALLETIFGIGSSYHDGAIYIQDGRIYRVGCVLPLSESFDLSNAYGTRHRAAIGITENSDCLAVVVSEERGEVSTVEGGQIQPVKSPEALASWIVSHLHRREDGQRNRWALTRATLTRNWRPKLAVLSAVIMLWVVGAYHRQNPQDILAQLTARAEQTYTVRVFFYNMPPGLVLDGAAPRSVQVRLRGRDDLLKFLDPGRLRLAVNLQGLEQGGHELSLGARHIDLPDGVRLSGFLPQTLKILLRTQKKQAATPRPQRRSAAAGAGAK